MTIICDAPCKHRGTGTTCACDEAKETKEEKDYLDFLETKDKNLGLDDKNLNRGRTLRDDELVH